MTTTQIIDYISEHPIFQDFSKPELSILSETVDLKEFKDGEQVFDICKKPEYLYIIHSGKFMLHLSNNEYKTLVPGQLIGEIGVINQDFRSGSVSSIGDSIAVRMRGADLFDQEKMSPEFSLKLLMALSKRITNYLRSREQVSTSEIIEGGETDTVEFKSTLRWNLKANKKDKNIEKAVLKTIAAFMNSKGGTLIVGVEDDGNILGIATDQFANNDKLLLHLTNIVKDRISSLHLKFLNFNIESIGQKEVLRIDCQPAHIPAYYEDDRDEAFFIRSGPSTTHLRLSKIHDYIMDRF